MAYALVDFELLARTPEHELEVVGHRRATYLQHQKDRFTTPAAPVPEHLRLVDILGVNYVYGLSESTRGSLWVVGRDPALFDYFLPERWRRTRRSQLSANNETYYTKTKDGIHLVWKVSRCGERPDVEPDKPGAERILEHGFNSPFEEFSFALELIRLGFPTTYPRAIYMTGQETRLGDYHTDERRYKTHQNLRASDGEPILRRDHNYITVWGFWNGLDEVLARKDEAYCRGINLTQAEQQGLLTKHDVEQLLEKAKTELYELGFEDLALKPSHFLVSLLKDGTLLRGENDEPLIRMCNFSLLRRVIALPPFGSS